MPALGTTTPSVLDRAALPLLRALVLVRVAVPAGATRTEIVRDFGPMVAHRLSPAEWRSRAEVELSALTDAGLVVDNRSRISANEAGIEEADAFLGKAGATKAAWPDLRDGRVVAKALGLDDIGPTRLKALTRPDGLRAAIVQKAHGLAVRGNPSPSKLRAQLAVIALERAFGNKIKTGLGAGSGFSAKAGRLLAGQLSVRPRDFGSDVKLIAALAAEAVDARQTELEALRQAILRGLFTSALEQQASVSRSMPRELPRADNDAGLPGVQSVEASRPDPEDFAAKIQVAASACAEGWPGNKKAYISHVWDIVSSRHAAWGLSEIEFKCMLAEAHRAGLVTLASADLKSKTAIEALDASAISYKNTIWHFIRVDEG